MGTSIEMNISGKLARIWLNRPEVFNSFNREMALLLQEKLAQCEENDDIRAVLISGRGKAF